MKEAEIRTVVRVDCESLLNKFQQTESVRFEVFSHIWRDMKFEQIFYGIARHKNRLFTRLILDMAYEFLLPPFTFQIRVGGLYLLYALYHLQTTHPPEKIRVALKDWEEIQKFEKEALDAQHLDVVYVWKKLLHMKAVDFSAMPKLLHFDKKRNPETAQVSESFMERPSAPQTVIHSSLLEELSNVHSVYQKLKSSVCSPSDSNVNLAHSDLAHSLRDTVLDFYRWQQRRLQSSASTRGDDGGEGTSTQHESSRRAGLLASIKSRAYGQAPEVVMSRRHRAVETESETKIQPNTSRSARSERIRRKTLRYRVSKHIQLTGDRWTDSLLSNTSICRLTSLNPTDEKLPQNYQKFHWKIENDQ